MSMHILWLIIWVISGLAGWGVATLAGMIVGEVVAEAKGRSAWGFLWVPVIWLLGAAWGLFALVHSIIELIAIVVGIIQASVA